LELSKSYSSPDDAAMGGYRRVLQNSNAWLTEEFGFWVIMKINTDKKPIYFYTKPVGGGSSEVKLTLPNGVMVRAHCHTHPHRISTGDFGADDKESFQKLQKVQPGIAFYLLNPYQEIRRARAECEFLSGTTVKWDSKVTA